jgi:homopolymeric O-antigen transport system ATP-binding protein
MGEPHDLRGLSAVEGHRLVKRYRLGELVSVRATLRGFRGASASEGIEALADVSFSVNRGECFGIVGPNGSGKSTIMQLIAGITLPTSGSLTVRGRVLPLLSVGSGFHPDLTGRENARLFGAILGIEPDVVEAHFDQIAAFAEVERHIDTPVKRYSEGMQARLSFAIGMVFPADIYLFDEVLAVVDGEFRARCVEAIAALPRAGRAVLFVSHDSEQMARLCDRVLWLDQGNVRALGSAPEVLDDYAHERATPHVAKRLVSSPG